MMSNAFYINGNGLHVHFTRVLAFRLIILIALWNSGMAGIVVFEEDIDVEEFPDVELSYTSAIKKSGIEGPIVAAHPMHACVNITRPPNMNDSSIWFVLISGNSCSFETKVLNAKSAGYSVAVIYTYRARVDNTNSHIGHYRFHSNISAVVIKTEDGLRIKDNYLYTIDDRFVLFIFPNNSFSIMTFLLLFSIVAGLFLVVMLAFAIIRFFQQSQTVRNGRLSSRHLKQLETRLFQKGNGYETCAICLEDYKDQEKLRILPCSHGYHVKCIDPWLTNNRPICPVCKQKVVLAGQFSEISADSDSDERSETRPLLQARRGDQHRTFDSVNVHESTTLNLNSPPLNPATAENARSTLNADVTPGGTNRQPYVHSYTQI